MLAKTELIGCVNGTVTKERLKNVKILQDVICGWSQIRRAAAASLKSAAVSCFAPQRAREGAASERVRTELKIFLL